MTAQEAMAVLDQRAMKEWRAEGIKRQRSGLNLITAEMLSLYEEIRAHRRQINWLRRKAKSDNTQLGFALAEYRELYGEDAP